MTASNDRLEKRAITTVRLEGRRRQELLNGLNAGKPKSPPGRELRRWERFAYDAEQILVTVCHPAGNTDTYRVVPRDISVGGLAFLHGQYLHPKSRCQLALPTPGGEWFRLAGRVVRCTHRQGLIHEVSVAFDERIDPTMFIKRPPAEPPAAASPAPAAILNDDAPATVDGPGASSVGPASDSNDAGAARLSAHKTVLLIDQIDQSRAVFGKWLRQQGMTVVDAADALTAREWFAQGRTIHLAILHLDRQSNWGWELVRQLRAKGYTLPVLAISLDNSDHSRTQALATGCSAFLPKPCSHQNIIDTLRRLLADAVRKA